MWRFAELPVSFCASCVMVFRCSIAGLNRKQRCFVFFGKAVEDFAANRHILATVTGSTGFHRVLPIKDVEAPIPVADLRLVCNVLRKVFRNMSNLFDMTASSGCSRKAGESSSDWKRTVTSALPFTTSMMVLAISEACRSPALRRWSSLSRRSTTPMLLSRRSRWTL